MEKNEAYCFPKYRGIVPHPCFLHFCLAVCIAGVYEESFGGGANQSFDCTKKLHPEIYGRKNLVSHQRQTVNKPAGNKFTIFSVKWHHSLLKERDD